MSRRKQKSAQRLPFTIAQRVSRTAPKSVDARPAFDAIELKHATNDRRHSVSKTIAALNAQLALQARQLAEIENLVSENSRRMIAEMERRSQRRRSLIPRTLAYVRSLFGYRFDLQPLSGVARQADGSWIMNDADPQFAFARPRRRPIGPGHYRLKIQVDKGLKDLEAPQVYFDTGGGINEAESTLLRVSAGAQGLVSNMLLPKGADWFRFDPSARQGFVSIGAVRLRRMLRLEYYARLVAKALRRERSQSGSVWQLLKGGLRRFRREGFKGVAAALRKIDDGKELRSENYQDWIEKWDSRSEAEFDEVRERLAGLSVKPLISVLMPVYNTPEKFLRDSIESVRSQLYDNWELCIADDCSTKPHVRQILESYAADDGRIKVDFRKKNGHISRATNSAMALADGDWIALLDHDDVLSPSALAEVACHVADHPDTQIVYSDEDKLGRNGERFDPYFKPDFSRELFRSQNYLNHLTVHRAENIRAVGGWRTGFEGSQDYDLNLRIFERIDPTTIRHIPKVLYHWRAAEGSTALAGKEKTYAHDAGLRALCQHIKRTGSTAAVESEPGGLYYRTHFVLPAPQPLVSLIIPTKDKASLLRGCVESIRHKTTYPNYELIVVDNNSSEPDALAYLDELVATPGVRVIRYERPFNYSAINNFAVRQAKGSIVGLINNDIEVISPDWLTEMASWSAQPDIGCVGAKLYYANDTIQHAGVILGIGGVAGHSHKYFPRHHAGYFSRLKLVQNVSAVTAACLLVRKQVYEEVGGLDETNLAIAFNDVDFCLKVRGAGYLNVWTPYAELYHLESVSRGAEDSPEKKMRFQREVEYMLSRWNFEDDPYYSPHLTRQREDFSLSTHRGTASKPALRRVA